MGKIHFGYDYREVGDKAKKAVMFEDGKVKDIVFEPIPVEKPRKDVNILAPVLSAKAVVPK